MSEESRQIAEALGSDGRVREVRLRAERRERIATTIAAGMAAAEGQNQNVHLESRDPIWYSSTVLAEIAVERADALMAELDRRRAAELEEARS